jgi:hypothetical protein
MLMFLRDSAKRSCSLRSQPSPKTMAEWRGSALNALPSYFLGQEATSGLAGGRTITGSVGRLRFQCTPSPQVPPPQNVSPVGRVGPCTLLIHDFVHSVREADVPLDSFTRCPGSTPYDSQFDAGSRSMMMDKHPPPANPPAPTFDRNEGLPTSPFLVPWTTEISGLSPNLSDPGPSRVSLGELTSATSRFVGGSEVPRSGMYHSLPLRNLGLRFDEDNDMHTNGGLTASMSCGVDSHYETAPERRFDTTSHTRRSDTGSCPRVDRRDSEPICVDGSTALDYQYFPAHGQVDRSALGAGSVPEARGVDHGFSCSVPAPAPTYTWQSLTDPTSPPLSRPVHPNPLELAHTNLISPPYQTAPLMVDPPPEVAALLTTQSSGEVVSAVFARNSPLVPWELPPEIEYFWLGLFRISEVKVTHACPLSDKTGRLISSSVCLFVRWKRVRGEVTQTA